MLKKQLFILISWLVPAGGVFFSCSSSPHDNLYKENICELKGLAGEEVKRGFEGRLTHFVTDSQSAAIRIFHHDSAETSGGWKGEHAGKWLYAASLAFERTHSPLLLASIREVCQFLSHHQHPNGYLGTYADSIRFYANPVQPRQTWDVWNAGYLLKGLIAAYRTTGDSLCLKTAERLAGLFIATFRTGGKNICNSGCFSGTASCGIIGEFADLYQITHNEEYLGFAVFVIEELNRRPGTQIVDKLLKEYDLAQVGEGKMYETLRCINGMIKVYFHTHSSHLLTAALHAWNDVIKGHLNAAGGPCGGVGIHPECFNNNYMFSCYYNSETCALMEWMEMNRLLLKATGKVCFAEELEKSVYNAVPGASFQDGNGWVYHSVMNGPRQRTSEWACCSSSGAIILETIPRLFYSSCNDTLMIHLYGPSKTTVMLDAIPVTIEQETSYPFEGNIRIKITVPVKKKFFLKLRIPAWVKENEVCINGKNISAHPLSYYLLAKKWHNDTLNVVFPFSLRSIEKTEAYNYKGEYIDKEIHYRAFYYGPLLYATAWKDEKQHPDPIVVSSSFSLSSFTSVSSPEGYEGKIFRLETDGYSLLFAPYYQIGKTENGSFHTVWINTTAAKCIQ